MHVTKKSFMQMKDSMYINYQLGNTRKIYRNTYSRMH